MNGVGVALRGRSRACGDDSYEDSGAHRQQPEELSLGHEFLLFSPNPGLLRLAANGLPGIKLEDKLRISG